jgi:signal transduction histidine kinase
MNLLESALNQGDSHFKKIIDLLPCYISIQGRDLKILFANKTVIDDFGNAEGKKCHKLYKDSDEECPSCPVQMTFHDKQTHTGEETVKLKDGSMCQIAVYSSPIFDDNGNLSCVVELSTNITRVKESQKELATLGQSVTLLSHAIKNILEGLQGGTYVVNEGLKDNDMKLALKGWVIVKRNIDDITDVVQNILFSAKKRKLRCSDVSPCSIIRDVAELYKGKAHSMDIDLKFKGNQQLPNVMLDEVSIRRMLNNFIWNALEACKRDNKSKAYFVNISADFYDDSHFKFEIKDNGTGMDKKTKKNIFKEYFTTKGTSGTGLGLTVANIIAKEHAGKIEVESKIGEGTTFRVILRMKPDKNY